MTRGGITSEIRPASVVWSKIRELSAFKEQAEMAIAQALRTLLDEVGEKAWLEQCQREMGWGRSTAYRHLSPEGMSKEREKDAERREGLGNRDAAPRQADTIPMEPDYPTPEAIVLSKGRQLQSFFHSLYQITQEVEPTAFKGTGRGTTYEDIEAVITWLRTYQSTLQRR